MKQAKCRICDKVIVGFTERDLDYRMAVHLLSHTHKELQQKKKAQLNQQEV